jgi:hypothetical protein
MTSSRRLPRLLRVGLFNLRYWSMPFGAILILALLVVGW